MKKATLLCFTTLVTLAVLFDFSEGATDFFSILDRETTEYLSKDDAKNRHRSKSSRTVSAPRNNKYLEASMQIIRGMAEAKAMARGRRGRSMNLDSTIKKAVKNKEIPKARQMIGHMFECHCPPKQGKCRREGLPRHCRKKNKQHQNVFKKLRKVLSKDEFDILLGITGDVSLIFVIDTTGSMGDEIEAAKTIAKAIAAHPRHSSVDFILSPFSDPSNSTAWENLYSGSDEQSFVQALDQLAARGGGDCPELTFNGIIDAIERGNPHVGSPMFVFTDAGAKDGKRPKYTQDNSVGLALQYMIPVNFFYSTESGRCGSFRDHDSLIDLMDSTGGFGMQFDSSGQMSKIGGVVSAALDGTATVHEGRSSLGEARSSRSPSTRNSDARRTYAIPVDDTVESLIVTYFTSSAANLVELRTPYGVPQPRTENLTQGGLWMIENPTLGIWELFVPASVGTHSFKVKATSTLNLEFDFFFLRRKRFGGEWYEYPIDYPLLNQRSTISLVIPLQKRLNLSSLKLSLVDGSGRVVKNANLAKPSLVGTFVPPAVPFKLKLSGTTVAGRPFQRISRKFINAKNVLLQLQSTPRYDTLECGKTLRLHFVIDYNGAVGEVFDVMSNSTLEDPNTSAKAIEVKYSKTVRNVWAGNRIFLTVHLKTAKDVTENIGRWDTIQVTVKKSPVTSEADVAYFIEHFKITCSYGEFEP